MLTSLNREGLETTLGDGESPDSFLYAPPEGPAWPCGPAPQDWAYLCELALENPRARRAIEGALSAVHHRAPIVLALKN